jgi:NADPH-dependent curcumin reductase CurA
MRGWIADEWNYSDPVPLGSAMRSIAVGEVCESRCERFAAGDLLVGWFGWQDYACVGPDKIIRRITETDLPPSLALGVLGLNGVTAYLALTKIGRPQAGETVLVSTAAGAVGSAVGQIARLLGCRTVGVADGTEKTDLCREVFGYDEAIDYKAGRFEDALARACPDGIDIYFDNVCGPISDAAMAHLATGARIVVCGTAAIPRWSPPPLGPRVHRALLVKRALMQGFVIFDHMAEFPMAVEWLANQLRSGHIAYREDILDGIEACPDALAGLYRGENLDKRIIRL